MNRRDLIKRLVGGLVVAPCMVGAAAAPTARLAVETLPPEFVGYPRVYALTKILTDWREELDAYPAAISVSWALRDEVVRWLVSQKCFVSLQRVPWVPELRHRATGVKFFQTWMVGSKAVTHPSGVGSLLTWPLEG